MCDGLGAGVGGELEGLAVAVLGDREGAAEDYIVVYPFGGPVRVLFGDAIDATGGFLTGRVCYVCRLRHYTQVLYPAVESVSVEVVDDLVGWHGLHQHLVQPTFERVASI
jgi:hypothetical protein